MLLEGLRQSVSYTTNVLFFNYYFERFAKDEVELGYFWNEEWELEHLTISKQNGDGNWHVDICQCGSVYDNLNDLNNPLVDTSQVYLEIVTFQSHSKLDITC